MNKRVIIPGRQYSKYEVLQFQKKLIEKHFCFLMCKIRNDLILVCTGEIKPKDCIYTYRIKIEYVAGHEPKTTILSPEIEPCKEIHMYKDHSICLHYPKDMLWNERTKVFQYAIPWISEWIIYYELYMINGHKWEGPESPVHIKDSDMNINKNID
jgi:hypothetical protein